jgi:hypothetical protein
MGEAAAAAESPGATGGGTPTSTSSMMSNGAGAPATPGSTGGGGSTTNDVNPGAWMAGFSDDLKGRVSAKGWKGPVELADSYFNLEKLLGAPKERLVTLPDKFMGDDGKLTAEGRGIYERLGTPKDAKGYELEKLLPAENGDKQLMEHFQNVFHEAGVPKGQAEAIVKNWNEYQAKAFNGLREQAIQRFKDADAQLRKDWGAAHDQNINIAKEGVRRLGHDAKTIDALSAILGHDKTMKLYHQLGSAVGESTFVAGKSPATVMEPSTAQGKLSQLKADKGFMEKVGKGDSESLALWTKLHEQAYPGTTSIR